MTLFATQLPIWRATLIRSSVNNAKRAATRFQMPFVRFSSSLNGVKTGPVKPKGLKGLMQVYGYSALAVYFTISAIDLPLSFLLVHSMGEERISVYMNRVKQLFNYGKDEQELITEVRERIKQREEDKKNGTLQNVSTWERFKQSTLLTEFILAYGIHKSLIVFRVPMTAAITPAASKLLQKYGINLSKKGTEAFKKMATNTPTKNKPPTPNEIIKNASIPRQTKSKGQKWFNGLM